MKEKNVSSKESMKDLKREKTEGKKGVLICYHIKISQKLTKPREKERIVKIIFYLKK